jgi:hypothetical protein
VGPTGGAGPNLISPGPGLLLPAPPSTTWPWAQPEPLLFLAFPQKAGVAWGTGGDGRGREGTLGNRAVWAPSSSASRSCGLLGWVSRPQLGLPPHCL